MRLVRHELSTAEWMACVSEASDVKHDIRIYPLPHMPVIKDLVARY